MRTRRSWVLAALVIGMFMAAIEATVVATAIPSIVSDLGGFQRFSWLFSSFLLAQAVATPLYGRLADLIGRRPVYVTGSILFLAGSLLCGASGSMQQLIAFRVLQGLGAGAIMPIALTIVGDLYSPSERARIQGYLASVWGISSIMGPGLGGVLVTTLGWPWIFYINLPIGVASVLMLMLSYHDPPIRGEARLDLPGAAFLVLGVSGLIVLLTEGQRLGFHSEWGSALWVLTIGGLAGFVFWERRAPFPLLPLHLMVRPIILTANVGAFLAGVLVIAVSSLVPTLVQGVMGHSPIVAGFSLTAMSIGWPTATTVGGHLLLRIGYRRTAGIGACFGMLGAGVLLLATGTQASPWMVAGGTLLSGAGLGLTTNTYLIAVQSSVSYQERGVATGANAFGRILGQAVGAALVGGVLVARLMAYLNQRDVPEAETVGFDVVNHLLDPHGAGNLQVALQEMVRSGLQAAISDTFWVVLGVALLVVLAVTRLPRGGPLEDPSPASSDGDG